MAKIQVNITTGGLGRQSANTDTWGGLFVEVDALPSGWAENEVKRIFKPEDVAGYGIVATATNQYYKLAYYHIKEVFRRQPNATLFVQLGETATLDEQKIVDAFVYANNNIRLYGFVFATKECTTSNATALNTAIANALTNNKVPARGIVSYKKESTGTIPDFSALSLNRVMVDIGNDATTGSIAKAIFDGALGMCGTCGTILGQNLLLSVHQKQSWASYPVNASGIYEELADINGDSTETLTQAEKDALDTKGVTYVSRIDRKTDAYFGNARMACAASDDYAILPHGRVIDKAIVVVYDSMVSELDGPVYVDPENGTLTAEDVARFTAKAYNAINTNMVVGKVGNKVEVSKDVATGQLSRNVVYVDPSQNVLQTEQVAVQVRIVPVGASKTIVLNIGLTASLN